MKLRARTSVVGTLTASLALALAGPAVAGNDAADSSSAVSGAALIRFPEFAGLTDSRALSAPLMLQGKLTDLGGKALSGAQVLLAAWPSNEAVSKLPVGGSFTVVPVARTVAGKDGAYQLRSLLTPLLTSLSGKDGLDVELDVFHGGRHYVYLTQLSSEGNGSWVHDFARGVDGQARELRSTATNALDLALDPAQGEHLSKDIERGLRIPTANEPIPGGPACGKYTVIKTNRAWTVAATTVARNRARAVTKYTEDATTTTSTGFSFGGAGEFKMNGARSRTAESGASWKLNAKKNQTLTRDYFVMVEHDTLERKCFGNKYGEYRHQYLTSPSRILPGFDNAPSNYPVWNCQENDGKTMPANADEVWTKRTKAATYEKAFTLFPIDGASFTGRALSGYSENVQVYFKFTNENDGLWCGHTGLPDAAGQRVQGFQA